MVIEQWYKRWLTCTYVARGRAIGAGGVVSPAQCLTHASTPLADTREVILWTLATGETCHVHRTTGLTGGVLTLTSTRPVHLHSRVPVTRHPSPVSGEDNFKVKVIWVRVWLTSKRHCTWLWAASRRSQAYTVVCTWRFSREHWRAGLWQAVGRGQHLCLSTGLLLQLTLRLD